MRGVLAELSPGSLADPMQPGKPPGVVDGRGRRAGREGRNPLHGANAPSVPWLRPSKLKQGLGSACGVEVPPGDNNSGENSPKVMDL